MGADSPTGASPVRAYHLTDLIGLACLMAVAIWLFYGAISQPGYVAAGLDMAQHYSRESFNRIASTDTHVPLWNPFEFSGFPAQADPQTGVFYPPSMLLRLFSLSTFLTWTAVFHVWLFGAGGYLLSRVAGAGKLAAFAAGAALMLGGIAMPRVYAGHFDVLRTVAWIPLAIAETIRSFERRTVLPTPSLVITLALALLGSFLQLSVYTFAVIALYGFIVVISPDAGTTRVESLQRLSGQYGLLVLLVLGITALQVVPSAKLIAAAGRTGGMSWESAIEDALPVTEVPLEMLRPARGEPAKESWERGAYVGWLLMVLAPLAWVHRGRRRTSTFLFVLAALALALASGGPLYRLHYLAFPMFRIPGRFLCFWSVPVAVLGALTLDAAGRRAAAFAGRWAAPLVGIAAAAVILVDMSGYARRFVDIQPLASSFTRTLPFTPSPSGRLLSVCENAVTTSEISAMGMPSAEGYNSYFLAGYARMAEKARGDQPADQLKAFPRVAQRQLQDIGVASAWNVTEIISCEPLPFPELQEAGRYEGMIVYRNPGAFGRVALRCDDRRPLQNLRATCSDPGVTINVMAADTPGGLLRARVSLQSPRTLVLSEPFYPERRAFIDGKETPLLRANMALSAVHVEAGFHTIELRFVPTTLYYGAAISVLTIAAWLYAAARLSATR